MPNDLTKMGPLAANHPMVDEQECAACKYAFEEGDYVTLVPVGPGADPEARAAAREGRAYAGVAVPVHWSCATGEEN
jgi:hypothetical protein